MSERRPTPEEVFAELHPPSQMDTRGPVPEWPLLWRGLALGGLALCAAWAGIRAVRWSWLALPLGVVCAVVAVLAAWASAIHLTGGEKFDDHPFI